MSVVGFDLGNESCIVAVARQRVMRHRRGPQRLNEESPAIVCFVDKQRFIGTVGAASSTMNPKNSISQIKRLLGRKFSDPKLQSDLASFPFRVTEGPDGFPLVHAQYLGEERTFTPTQMLAMVLSNLKGIAEGNLNTAVVDCCIGIPVYFTDLQRRAVLDAATMVGLRPLRLFHETTATALAYGMYRTDLPQNDQLNIAFVDVGHASMQVSVVGYKKGQIKMLSHTYDRSLGGRDFDEALFKHFAAKFKEEYKVDVYQNAHACIRLCVACEKLKKMLSANPEAPLNIECLMDEKDVWGLIKREVFEQISASVRFIKREEFEQISASVLERVKGPLEKALAEAGLTTENVHSVEVVGSGSRVPAIVKIITDFFGKEPRRTMNASECVARGCALQCAILSPTFKVREFQVNDGFPFSIAFSWNVDYQNARLQTLVFPKGNAIPSIKALTFFKSSTFEVDVLYVDQDDSQVQQKISTYTIGPFQTSKGEMAKLKMKLRLNIHGIVTVDSAMMLEEDMEVPVSSVVELSKKKVKKTTAPVHELVYGALAEADLQKAVEKEYDMALQDRVMEKTKEKKNAVEAYVYDDMRNKIPESPDLSTVLETFIDKSLQTPEIIQNRLKELLPLLEQNTANLVENAGPVRQIFIDIQDALTPDVAELLSQVSEIDDYASMFQKARRRLDQHATLSAQESPCKQQLRKSLATVNALKDIPGKINLQLDNLLAEKNQLEERMNVVNASIQAYKLELANVPENLKQAEQKLEAEAKEFKSLLNTLKNVSANAEKDKKVLADVESTRLRALKAIQSLMGL